MVSVQVIFECSLEEYVSNRRGRDVDPPSPTSCPCCKIGIPPKKHGYYERYIVTRSFCELISIKRFYCPYCGKTISFLPSFCIPYFQHVLYEIWEVLTLALYHGLSYDKILHTIFHMTKQHFSFYCKRFLSNMQWIQTGLRIMNPLIPLPDGNAEKKKKAKKVLDGIVKLYPSPSPFSKRFFEECHQSFLASHHFS